MAEDFGAPVRRSYLSWFFAALGWKYTLLLPLVGMLAFAVVLVLVLRGKGPAMVGALLFVVPLPIFVGLMGVVDGLMSMFQVLAMADISPKPSVVADGVSMSLVTAWVGMLLAVPSYLVAVGGLIVHAFQGALAPGDRTFQPPQAGPVPPPKPLAVARRLS